MLKRQLKAYNLFFKRKNHERDYPLYEVFSQLDEGVAAISIGELAAKRLQDLTA